MNLSESYKNRLKKLSGIITESSIGCDVFDTKTNIPDYDDILNGISPRVFNDVKGEIVYMSPQEYINAVAKQQGTSYEQQFKYIDDDKVDNLVSIMNGGGGKINMIYIDYARNKGQEGRHRAVAAGKYGCKKIPVAVFEFEEEEKNEGENLISKVGVWPDVIKSEEGNPVVVYDLNIWNETNLFLSIFSKSFDHFFLDEALSNKIYRQGFVITNEIYIKKLEDDWDNLLPNDLKKIIRDAIEPIIKEVEHEEDYESFMKNANSYVRYLFYAKDKLPELYGYMIKMVNSIILNKIIDSNYYEMDNYENKELKVKIDTFERKAYVEIINHNFYEMDKYKSGKALLNKQIEPLEESSYVDFYSFDSKNIYDSLTPKTVNEFISKFPYKK